MSFLEQNAQCLLVFLNVFRFFLKTLGRNGWPFSPCQRPRFRSLHLESLQQCGQEVQFFPLAHGLKTLPPVTQSEPQPWHAISTSLWFMRRVHGFMW